MPTPTQPLIISTQQNEESPPDPPIAAKKRVLHDRTTSPHEESNQHGGWMFREKQHALDPGETPGIHTDIKSWNQNDPTHDNMFDTDITSEGQDSHQQRARSSPPLKGELKVTDRTRLEASLRAIIPGATIHIDFTASGRGGAAIIVMPNFTVKDMGNLGTGHAAWTTIESVTGDINIMSVHAPNTNEDRTIFWEQLYQIIQVGNWVLAGDFNMVKVGEDSKGKSALITGAEARVWKFLSDSKTLVDAYFCAVSRHGGNFTRYAFCGKRYDHARLDRFYLTGAGQWTHLIERVQHHSDHVISDHTPITLTCQLAPQQDGSRKLKTYFKMELQLLKRRGVMQKVREAWNNHPSDAGNPQRRWMPGWLRIKRVLKDEKTK
ncbi:hypothetical protein R1sor_016289 [Riccia sorocarpa]|uniref:Endonuclease/exonuclease/phosphatase domain-containing protein n=1 Tax=Riccia sorocarpa TaxID=122646 RepID=A0ABD3HI30_9MARC